MMAFRVALCLFLLALGAHLAAAQAQAPAPDMAAIPPACLESGSTLQTECASTFAEAQTFFGTAPGQIPPPGSISPQQIQQYLAQAKPPSPSCCKVACKFNNDFCSCNRAVVDFAASLSGSADVFNTIGQAFATACRFKAFIGATCPVPALQATTPKDACPL